MRLSLSTKVFLGFLALLVTFALLAFFSVLQIRAMAADLRTIKDGHIALARLTARLETHQKNRSRYLDRGMEEHDLRNKELVLSSALHYFSEVTQSTLQELKDAAEQQMKRPTSRGVASKASFYRGVLDRVSRMSILHRRLDELTAEILDRVTHGKPLDDALVELEAVEKSVNAQTFALNNLINDEMDAAVHRAEEDERAAVWSVVVMTFVALLIGLVLSIMSGRALAPINHLVRYARAISRGDYEQAVPAPKSDELVSLAEELRLMARSRKDREEELDKQAAELERAYRRVEELKRYHESIVRSLRTGVVVTDRDLRVTSTNRAAELHWGLGPDAVRGQPLSALPLAPALSERLGALEDLMAQGATFNAAAVPVGELLADVTVAPLESEKGDVLGLVVALEDVTEAVRTKEALIRSERLAAIGRMSAHVTHEIRNPLSSIGLNAEMLEDLATDAANEGEAEAARTLCRAIVREVDRLSAITDEYLRFARLPRPEPRRQDVGELLSSIEAFVRRDCAAAGVTVSVNLPGEPLIVEMDPDQIRQAVLNLVRNGKESMPEGGALTLGARLEGEDAPDAPPQLVIFVRDAGVGIPEAHLDRIFDPFYSTKLTGTGLGLALTQQIITEHGGTLEVSSEVGAGTEFRVVLPARQPAKITVLSDDVEPAPRAAS
ncbi:MAG: PAS domain-containing protein [Myxococcales bacterium]|nr:PAS domain-containing protein [Myxococcales bacterium]